jgi:hypothetical protein
VALALQDTALRVAAGSLVAVAVLVLLSGSALSGQFTAAVDTGSIEVRVDRLPVIGALVAAHPWKGLGISGLVTQGIPTTDSSYLLTYAEVGVLGLAVLVAVLAAGIGEAAVGAWVSAGADRLVAAAAALGLALVAAGTFTFDTFSVPAAAETFWLLAALGVVAQDGVRRPRRLRTVHRLGAVLAALVVGIALRVAAPTHVAQTWQFEALQPYPATVQAATYTGRELRTTFCALARDAAPGPGFVCQGIGDAPGQGLLRLQAGSSAALAAERDTVLSAVAPARIVSRVELSPRGPAERGVPTGLRTAPGWLPVLVAVLVLPLPGGRRRSRDAVQGLDADRVPDRRPRRG